VANSLRVQIVKTTRTDLLCIRCGDFGSQFAIVAPGVDQKEAQAGVHRKCIPLVKARRSPAPDTVPCAPPPAEETES